VGKSETEITMAEMQKQMVLMMEEMKKKPQNNYNKGYNNNRGPRKCYNCGSPDHISPQCPDRGNPKCYNCDQKGHMAKECPEPKREKRNQPQSN
jgi:hypothetical protein